jgi:hypothetical protein
MAMASGMYGLTLRDILDASALPVDVVSDTLRQQLVTDTHTPNFNTHAAETDITNEVAGSGDYTAGGVTLASKTLTASGGVLTFDAADASLTGTTLSSVRGRIVFDDTVTAPVADPLVVSTTFGADYSTSSGTFAITENASGIWTIDYTP